MGNVTVTVRPDSLLLKVRHRHKRTRENSEKSGRRLGFEKSEEKFPQGRRSKHSYEERGGWETCDARAPLHTYGREGWDGVILKRRASGEQTACLATSTGTSDGTTIVASRGDAEMVAQEATATGCPKASRCQVSPMG